MKISPDYASDPSAAGFEPSGSGLRKIERNSSQFECISVPQQRTQRTGRAIGTKFLQGDRSRSGKAARSFPCPVKMMCAAGRARRIYRPATVMPSIRTVGASMP
jgi:hypothetical protein